MKAEVTSRKTKVSFPKAEVSSGKTEVASKKTKVTLRKTEIASEKTKVTLHSIKFKFAMPAAGVAIALLYKNVVFAKVRSLDYL
ncbi:hypothetical protein H6G74_13110 [Nostoc spongiaeforme FACHB-130]|uniref:Uncharacterized protein n=1 Tax=Nostoc spongiaeforme FACHB-130 TaxID=1357510 RepID=A0ABR8FV19_9NOSO|nr:hypothetical protein [Nostoc spongiaeforme]MBD2595261.1 hypothetical protein [Nostoc spongiaeforme FACHB-130]